MEKQQQQLETAIREAISPVLRRFPSLQGSLRPIGGLWAAEVLQTIKRGPQDEPYAPDQFTFSVNPSVMEDLQTEAAVVQSGLGHALEGALIASGYQLSREPHVALATDPTLSSGEVRIIAWHSRDPLQLNSELPPEPEPVTDRPPAGAFLIVSGKRHFRCTTPLVRIGRHTDNDLVLDDPHVSRRHVQLRASHGRYMLIDLDSTAGTRVNGKRVHEALLRPGDVIHAASVEMIYGEDVGGPPEGTPPYEPRAEDEARRHVTPLNLKVIKDAPTERLPHHPDRNA